MSGHEARLLWKIFTCLSVFLAVVPARAKEPSSPPNRMVDGETHANDLKTIENRAENGAADAQFHLGSLYAVGRGLPVDQKMAFLWWLKAAKQGLPQAQSNLGTMYAQGLGVTRDFAKARKWWLKAAQRNDGKALYGLGLLYAQGLGVPRNMDLAREWWIKAAAASDPEALFVLGELNVMGIDGRKNYGEARKYWLKAAKLGHAGAEAGLAMLYAKGLGGHQDLEEALAWISLAADQKAKYAAPRDILQRNLPSDTVAKARIRIGILKNEITSRMKRTDSVLAASGETPLVPGRVATASAPAQPSEPPQKSHSASNMHDSVHSESTKGAAKSLIARLPSPATQPQPKPETLREKPEPQNVDIVSSTQDGQAAPHDKVTSPSSPVTQHTALSNTAANTETTASVSHPVTTSPSKSVTSVHSTANVKQALSVSSVAQSEILGGLANNAGATPTTSDVTPPATTAATDRPSISSKPQDTKILEANVKPRSQASASVQRSLASSSEKHPTAGIDITAMPAHRANTHGDAGPLIEHPNKTLVRMVQKKLLKRGYNPGPIDGILGDHTRRSIELFEKESEMPLTDGLTSSLVARLNITVKAPPEYSARKKEAVVTRELVLKAQQLLHDAGYDTGPIDGMFGSRTRHAVRAYQRARHLPVTGMITPELISSLEK